jgi:hypothetical protein
VTTRDVDPRTNLLQFVTIEPFTLIEGCVTICFMINETPKADLARNEAIQGFISAVYDLSDARNSEFTLGFLQGEFLRLVRALPKSKQVAAINTAAASFREETQYQASMASARGKAR